MFESLVWNVCLGITSCFSGSDALQVKDYSLHSLISPTLCFLILVLYYNIFVYISMSRMM